jgi:hypothetical protein
MFTAKVLMYVSGSLMAVCLVLGLLLYAENVRLADCKNEIDDKELEIKALRKRVDEFRAVITEQSKSIDGLKQASEQRAAAADAALAAARADAAKGLDARRRLASLLASPTPAGAKCEAAVAAVRKDLKK